MERERQRERMSPLTQIIRYFVTQLTVYCIKHFVACTVLYIIVVCPVLSPTLWIRISGQNVIRARYSHIRICKSPPIQQMNNWRQWIWIGIDRTEQHRIQTVEWLTSDYRHRIIGEWQQANAKHILCHICKFQWRTKKKKRKFTLCLFYNRLFASASLSCWFCIWTSVQKMALLLYDAQIPALQIQNNSCTKNPVPKYWHRVQSSNVNFSLNNHLLIKLSVNMTTR